MSGAAVKRIEDLSHDELEALTAATDAKGGVFNDPDLAAMNAKYAVVKIGGKTRVVSLEASPAYPGSMVPVFSTIHDFCAFHAKIKKEVVENGTTKRISSRGAPAVRRDRVRAECH